MSLSSGQHQQVLFQLQQLRGRLVQERTDIRVMDRELEVMRLSVEQSGSLGRDEAERIALLLSSFREAMLSDLSHCVHPG